MRSTGTYIVCAILVVVLIGPSCSGGSSGAKEEPGKVAGKIFDKPPSFLTDTLLIENAAAVFFQPDTIQWEAMKASLDTNVWETMHHEYFFQVRNAKHVIRQSYPAIKIIDASKARFLQFVKKDGSRFLADLDKVKDPYGLMLFDGVQDPQPTDMMNIDTGLGFYFKK